MYGKLINGRMLVAPSRLSGDGVVVYNPPEEMYLAAGYLPVRWTERPAEGEYECAWEQADNEIVQVWTAVEPAPEAPDPDAMIAVTETSMTATRNYAVDDLLSVGGALYAVTAAIPSGGAITPGVNVTPTTMAEQLALLADKKS